MLRSLLLMVSLLATGCGGGTVIVVPTPVPSPLTAAAWILFTDNGIVEMRTRFEAFADGRTPQSVVENDIAYFEREIGRVNAIVPDPCWADMHAAYLAVMVNAKEMLAGMLSGDMDGAQTRYADTGRLNAIFTKEQGAVAAGCA